MTGTEGVDFISCRICGDRRRVISGRHLSKHDIGRATYMEEHGLTADELSAKAFRAIQSSRDEYRPYNKKEWIAAIRRVYRLNGSLLASRVRDSNFQHLYSQGVWIFGDWYSALEAAGLNPEKLGNHRFWDPEEVLREIRTLKRKTSPLYPVYVMKNHRRLFSAARRHYRSWAKALRAAGISHFPRCRGRLNLLCKLRDTEESEQAISNMLRAELEYYFGSIEKAMDALRTDKRLLNRWSRQKVINIIAQQANSDTRRVTMWRKNAALVSASAKRFGTWRKAVKAAGVMYGRE